MPNLTEAEKLSLLKKNRGTIKSQVTRILNYLTGVDAATADLDEIAVREQKIRELWDQFDEIQIKIEDLTDAADQREERVAFETSYYRAIALAKKFWH